MELCVPTVHGALWLVMKTDGQLQERAQQVARFGWWGQVVLTLLLTFVTFRVQPHIPSRLGDQPWGYVFPLLAITGLFAIRWYIFKKAEVSSFLASCAYILGKLTSTAFGLYPYVLPSNRDPAMGLTVHQTAAPEYGLKVGLVWWVLGMILVTGYFVYA